MRQPHETLPDRTRWSEAHTQLTVLVTVLGFIFAVWQYRTEQIKTRVALNQQNLKEAAERLERARRNDETAQREFMRPLLLKQQELYFEAATAAATLLQTISPNAAKPK